MDYDHTVCKLSQATYKNNYLAVMQKQICEIAFKFAFLNRPQIWIFANSTYYSFNLIESERKFLPERFYDFAQLYIYSNSTFIDIILFRWISLGK